MRLILPVGLCLGLSASVSAATVRVLTMHGAISPASADYPRARPVVSGAKEMIGAWGINLSNIAGDKTNTIVFPMPVELMNLMMRGAKPGE